jgi:hypothetical protein
MLKRYQFINWFPAWSRFHVYILDPQKTDLALIYEWSFSFGFWELRKWKCIIKE